MNVKKEIFSAIKTTLLNKTKINSVKLFNSQFSNLGDEDVISFPSVLVEFSLIDYISELEGFQKGDFNVRLHVGFQTLKTDDLSILDLLETINFEVSGIVFEVDISGFSRLSERQDVDHDNLIVWTLDFKVSAIDKSAQRNNRLRRAVITDVCIDPEITLNINE